MRSLEYWTKYLDEQEQALQERLGDSAKQEAPVEQPPAKPSVSQAPPVEQPSARPSVSEAAPDNPVATAVSAEPEVVPREKPRQTAGVKKKSRRQTTEAARPEAARNSYKKFKETREQLLQRLLDPEITLEDTARILNVCPTTVRRYTNRGLLKHFRTPGNQRRFRLSDVLAFMESQGFDPGEVE